MSKVNSTNSPATKKGSLKVRKTLVAYSFILPNLVGFFVLTFVPIVFSLILSLCEWNSGGSIKFVGLDNFVQMFTKDKSFWISLKNTLDLLPKASGTG